MKRGEEMGKEKTVEKLTGVVEFRPFAAGSKSESQQPFLVLEDGTSLRIKHINDNPFSNETLKKFEGKTVVVIGVKPPVDAPFSVKEIEAVLPKKPLCDVPLEDQEHKEITESKPQSDVVPTESESEVAEETVPERTEEPEK